MSMDLQDTPKTSAGIEDSQTPAGLTRRSFLDRLKTIGIGLAAAVALGVKDSDANRAEAAPIPADPPAELPPGTAEPAEKEIDPNDPRGDFAQWYYRRRRRYWR